MEKSTHPSTQISTHPSTHTSPHPSTHPSTYTSTHISTHTSTHISTHTSTHPSTHTSIESSTNISVESSNETVIVTIENCGSIQSISHENKTEALKFAGFFKTNLVNLLMEAKRLISFVNSHKDVISGSVVGSKLDTGLLDIAIAAASAAEPDSLIKGFIIRSESHWDKIHAKDLDFLINNADVLFKGARQSEINEFSRSFQITDVNGNKIITSTKIDVLWLMFRAMVCVCIKHIYYGRDPVNKEYQNTYFSNVNAVRYNQLFKPQK